MQNLFAQAAALLINSLGGFLTMLLLLRFYLQAFRVSFANPVGHFVLQLTNWLVLPLRRIIPSAMGFDLASLLPAFVIQLCVLTALFFLGDSLVVFEPRLLFWVAFQSLTALLRMSLYLLIGALVLQAVLSWMSPYSPLSKPLHQITQPFLSPWRKIIPPFSGIDLSPLVVILLAQVVLIFLR